MWPAVISDNSLDLKYAARCFRLPLWTVMYFFDQRASFSSIHFEAASSNFFGRFTTAIPLTASSIARLRTRSAWIARSFLLVLVVSRTRMPRTANSIHQVPPLLYKDML